MAVRPVSALLGGFLRKGRVADVADRDFTGQDLGRVAGEYALDEAEVADEVESRLVVGEDSGRVLAAVLQELETLEDPQAGL